MEIFSAVQSGERERRMTKRTGAERGAPFGNKNRLKHGLYTREALGARQEASGGALPPPRDERAHRGAPACTQYRARGAAGRVCERVRLNIFLSFPAERCDSSARGREPRWKDQPRSIHLGPLPSHRMLRMRCSPGMTAEFNARANVMPFAPQLTSLRAAPILPDRARRGHGHEA